MDSATNIKNKLTAIKNKLTILNTMSVLSLGEMLLNIVYAAAKSYQDHSHIELRNQGFYQDMSHDLNEAIMGLTSKVSTDKISNLENSFDQFSIIFDNATTLEVEKLKEKLLQAINKHAENMSFVHGILYMSLVDTLFNKAGFDYANIKDKMLLNAQLGICHDGVIELNTVLKFTPLKLLGRVDQKSKKLFIIMLLHPNEAIAAITEVAEKHKNKFIDVNYYIHLVQKALFFIMSVVASVFAYHIVNHVISGFTLLELTRSICQFVVNTAAAVYSYHYESFLTLSFFSNQVICLLSSYGSLFMVSKLFGGLEAKASLPYQTIIASAVLQYINFVQTSENAGAPSPSM